MLNPTVLEDSVETGSTIDEVVEIIVVDVDEDSKVELDKDRLVEVDKTGENV